MSKLICALTVLAVSTARADTIYVDVNCPGLGDGSELDPYCLIQTAIDNAVDTDEIIVADGLYTGPGNRDIDFGGRLITVRSANGPDNCIIDCQGRVNDYHRGFQFHGGETPEAVLNGFTVRGGFVFGDGGGIHCVDSSPTIINCVIVDNVAFEFFLPKGGGIYSAGGSPTIINCTISGNQVPGGEFPSYGGGIYCTGGSPTIVNCSITGNSAFAIAAFGHGGGAYFIESSALLANCILSDNRAGIGAGVRNYAGSVTMINCTLSGNGYQGALNNSGIALVINCIIRGNNGADVIDSSGGATILNSNIEGGWPGIGNIDADPMFVAASECCLTTVQGSGPGCSDPACETAVCDVMPSCCDLWWGQTCGELALDLCSICPNDYRLSPGSPCIDAGDNTAVPKGVLRDLDGNPRFVADACAGDSGATVDMGAYEFQGTSCNLGNMMAMLAAWGRCNDCGKCPSDFDGDCSVGIPQFP